MGYTGKQPGFFAQLQFEPCLTSTMCSNNGDQLQSSLSLFWDCCVSQVDEASRICGMDDVGSWDAGPAPESSLHHDVFLRGKDGIDGQTRIT